MKVIFLDFDGVINNWDHFDGVDYENVKNLLKIIKVTGAKIVVTSSTKYSFQKNLLIDYNSTSFFQYVKTLKDYGVEIIDVTPFVDGNREHEILEYLRIHKDIEQYLILDDDIIMSELREHEVFLDLYKGICEYIKI